MKKGVIMEIDDAFLTLLTPEGEFLRARKQNEPYAIGEEIHFFPIENKETSKRFSRMKNLFIMKPVWYGVAALLILMGSFIPMYQDNVAYAYMSIDVNPSIELGVNKKMQVVELTGFNKEGKRVISKLKDWKNEDFSTLTQSILTEIQKEGFLNKNNQVILSTVRMKHPEEKVEKKLKEKMDVIKESVSKHELELTVITGTEKELKKAHELGITTGKYQEEKIDTTLKHVDEKQNAKPETVTPPGQNKKQQPDANSSYKAFQGNNHSNGNSISNGQFKKMEEEQSIQKKWKTKENPHDHKDKDLGDNKNWEKDKSSENKKSRNDRSQNEKHRN